MGLPVRPSICLSVCTANFLLLITLTRNLKSSTWKSVISRHAIRDGNVAAVNWHLPSFIHFLWAPRAANILEIIRSYNPLVLFLVSLLTFGLSNAAVTSPDYISRMALYRSEQSATQFEVTFCHFAIRNADWAAGWTAEESKFYSGEGQILFFYRRSLDWLWDRSNFLLKGYRG